MTAPSPRPGEPFEHPALHYAGDQGYLEGTVPFIETALAAGRSVAVAVPAERLALIRDALGSDAARVTMFDMTEEGANPGRIIPTLREFADTHPSRRVHIVGEAVWPWRTDLEYPACVQHEALANFAFTGREVTLLCPYDCAGLEDRAIVDSCATHPVVIDRSGPHPSGLFDPARMLTEYNLPLPERPWTAIEREFDRASIENARWFTTAYGRHAGLSAEQLVDLEIAVTELVTNSVLYGPGTGVIRIWVEHGHLVCEVEDAAHRIDPLAGTRPFTEDEALGRGLLLVNQVVDLMRTHLSAHGTTRRVHLRLP